MKQRIFLRLRPSGPRGSWTLLYFVLDLQHALPAAVSVDVKTSKKKDSASVKVDGRFCLTLIANTGASLRV